MGIPPPLSPPPAPRRRGRRSSSATNHPQQQPPPSLLLLLLLAAAVAVASSGGGGSGFSASALRLPILGTVLPTRRSSHPSSSFATSPEPSLACRVPRGGADFVGDGDGDDDSTDSEGGGSPPGLPDYYGGQRRPDQQQPQQQYPQQPPQYPQQPPQYPHRSQQPPQQQQWQQEPSLPGQGGGGGGGVPPPDLPPGPGDGYSDRMPPRLPPRGYHQQQQQQQQQQFGAQPQRYGPPPPRSQMPGQAQGGGQPQSQSQSQTQTQTQQPKDTTEATLEDLEALADFDKDMIFKGLKKMYRKKIMPLEISSRYGHFHSSPLSPSDFEAKPMVLLLGQYSVGKTSFIRYLLGRDFQGMRIGPEPTTDRFVSIMHGRSDKIVPGAALCSQADRPFRGLSPFGNNFLSRFEGVEMDSPILRNITLVDTPGILSGQKQMIGRNYDYEAVMKWFAERADLIIIMFDAHKLDISDELKRVIELMRPHSDKVRVVLNKADSVSTQQLMRVYGALMWSLGKVMNTPEVCRVYMGSFWGAPLQNTEQARLLTQEKVDLFNDIARLPQGAVMRRINELVKRARSVKVHAYIIHYLRKQMPYKPWGRREKQQKMIDNLDREFVMCARRYELPRGDFPDVRPFRQALMEVKDLATEFQKLDKKMVKEMEQVFSVEIPTLLEQARNS